MLLRFLRLLREDRILKQPGKARRAGQGTAREALQKEPPVQRVLTGGAAGMGIEEVHQ